MILHSYACAQEVAAAVKNTQAGGAPFRVEDPGLAFAVVVELHRGPVLCRFAPVKGLFIVAALAFAVGTARADVSKQAPAAAKMPASARVFVLDKDMPPTDKTTPLPPRPPALKSKS
jgi:hypothetical protein